MVSRIATPLGSPGPAQQGLWGDNSSWSLGARLLVEMTGVTPERGFQDHVWSATIPLCHEGRCPVPGSVFVSILAERQRGAEPRLTHDGRVTRVGTERNQLKWSKELRFEDCLLQ